MSSPDAKRPASPDSSQGPSKRQKRLEDDESPNHDNFQQNGAEMDDEKSEEAGIGASTNATAGGSQDADQLASHGQSGDEADHQVADEESPPDDEPGQTHTSDQEADEQGRPRPRKSRRNRQSVAEAVERIYLSGNPTGRFSTPRNIRPSMSADERQHLMDELKEQVLEFHGPEAQQEKLSCQFSAPVDDLETAARFLGIDVTDPDQIHIFPDSNLRLRVDQVQNVAFMVRCAEGSLKGMINANAHGTGKTIEALASVYFLARRREASKSNDHKATLILCPHQALSTWQSSWSKFFSPCVDLHLFSRLTTSQGETSTIDLEKEAMTSFLNHLDPLDPKASCTIILSTYDEFADLFLVQRAEENVVKEKRLSSPGSKLSTERANAFKVAKQPLLFDLDLKSKAIGTLIADEAHKIKDPRSRRAHACYLVEADVNFLLTASPMQNKVSDLRGLLFALFKPTEWKFRWPVEKKAIEIMEMYDEACLGDANANHANSSSLSPGMNSSVPSDQSTQDDEALKKGQNLWRLNPHAFRWLGNDGNFGADFARIVVGSICRLCVLSRDRSSIIQLPNVKEVTVADTIGIPNADIRTVILEMQDRDEEIYRLRTGPWFENIFRKERDGKVNSFSRVAGTNETPKAAFNRGQDTHLDLMTADPGLADVLRLVPKTDGLGKPAVWDQVIDFKAAQRTNTDAGMSFYYMMTRCDSDPEAPPADRATMIRHIVRRSPKLRWLLLRLNSLKQQGEKALVYCVHPQTQWMIEGLMAMAEFKFYSLRGTHDIKEVRSSVLTQFGDPQVPIDFLVSTMRLLGHGVEGLQNDCSNMIIFEMCDNVPTILSTIGRIHRVGQKQKQNVFLLTLAKSYDDYTLYRQYQKYSIVLLGMGVLGTAINDRVRRWQMDYEEELQASESSGTSRRRRRNETPPPPPDLPSPEIKQRLASGEMVRRQLGARCNRSYVPWEYAAVHHKYKGFLFWKSIMNIGSFAAEEFQQQTNRGKKIVDSIQGI